MKMHLSISALLTVIATFAGLNSGAQSAGTVFTYQGRLENGGAPFTGVVEFVPSLWDAASDGSLVATNDPESLIVGVTNGLFTMPLDFGANFPGAARWLQLEVRTNIGPFTVLSPRQRITPTPYALTASNLSGTVSAGQLSGTLPSDLLSGNYSGAINFNNPSNTFSGNGAGLTSLNASNLVGVLPSASLSGAYSNPLTFNNPSNVFVGDGAGLTSMNASELTGGIVPDARLGTNVARTSQVWLLGGNAGTTPGTQFLGTIDDQPLEVRVNNQPALRLEPGMSNSVNIVGGWIGNAVAPGLAGATVAGGGAGNYSGLVFSNRVEADFGTVSGGGRNTVQATFGTIGGGSANTIYPAAYYATIAGGTGNTVVSNAAYSTIGGGINHWNGGYMAAIAGGYGNGILPGASYAAVAGGYGNWARSNAAYAAIGGGKWNSVQNGTTYGTIGGGYNNAIHTNAHYSTVSGGSGNVIQTQADYGVIGGGAASTIEFGADISTVSGGENNVIQYDADRATIGGGYKNTIQTNSDFATIAGGGSNLIGTNATSATIAGGYDNTIRSGAVDGSIGGGWYNTIETNAIRSTISGGSFNLIANDAGYASIGGGRNNTVETNSLSGTISGGAENSIQANAWSAAIGGGYRNLIASGATDSIIGGGIYNANETNAYGSTIAGGTYNTNAPGVYMGVIGGGNRNMINGIYGTIPGGVQNSAAGYAFAAGRRAKAQNIGAFVWSDSTDADFTSTAANQFNVRASGGVRLQTGGAGVTVDGQPLLAATGSGAQLTGLNASQLTSGTVPDGRLSGTYSSALNLSNPANQLTGSGAGLTSLNASQLTSGIVPDGRLGGIYSGALNFNNPANAFSGNGSGLTLLNAAELTGNLPASAFAGTYSQEVRLMNPDNQFAGIGAGLTLLDASQLATGTVPDERLDANIARTNQVWLLGGNAGTAPGKQFIGTSDYQPLVVKVNGARALRLEPTSDTPNIIGGHTGNSVQSGLTGVTIGGGGTAFGNAPNVVSNNGSFATIGGGFLNTVTNYGGTISGGGGHTVGSYYGAIGGGTDNRVLANYATIGGGYGNEIQEQGNSTTIAGGRSNIVQISGISATIGGGFNNTIQSNANGAVISGGEQNTVLADGDYATIPGGRYNVATNFAFAGGYRAKANHTGAFVWGDSSQADIESTNANSVTMRAAGGYRLFSNGNTSAGVSLAPGGTSWAVISDREVKKDFAPVDNREVLEKLASLPITHWHYRWENSEATPHIGPMAQDFKAAFYPGRDDKSITTQEADGVALAAIQGLNQKLEQENAKLRKELDEVKQLLQKLTGN